MTAAHAVPPRAGRRHRSARRRRPQPYGISEPGTYSTIPAWWSREQWRSECYSDLHTAAVDDLRRQVGKRGPVSIKACWALARALSACADDATGRNAMPGTAALTGTAAGPAKPDQLDLSDAAVLARMTAATGYAKTTLQKAARVLAARGWIVLLRPGKNWLTREERQELWRAGSAARQRRNVWACTIPEHMRGPGMRRVVELPSTGSVDNSTSAVPPKDAGCALPTTRRVSGSSLVSTNKIFKSEQASTNAPSGRPPTNEGSLKRTYRADWRTVRLAKDLRTRIYWLRHTPHQRIMPSLDRFARAGWTAADIQRELDELLAARSWEVPTGRTTETRAGKQHRYPLRCPWGYLAMLLRGLEPADLVTRREYEQATRRAELEYQQLLVSGPECPHGRPGGNLPSPAKGIRACPLCRADVSAG